MEFLNEALLLSQVQMTHPPSHVTLPKIEMILKAELECILSHFACLRGVAKKLLLWPHSVFTADSNVFYFNTIHFRTVTYCRCGQGRWQWCRGRLLSQGLQ